MTIALGYHCQKGVIVAADTLVVVGEGELQEGNKLYTDTGLNGSYAIVTAGLDGNAAQMIITEILAELARTNVESYAKLGQIFKRHMTDWRRGYGNKKTPDMQFLLAAKLQGQIPKLYFCEPPNTFAEKDDYYGIGYGSSVTDRLYETLFNHLGGVWIDVQHVLRRIAYLMYQAKKNTTYCGKGTTCAIVFGERMFPREVASCDFEQAESMSVGLDYLLSSTAEFSLGSTADSIEKNADELGGMLKDIHLRDFIFHDNFGDEIKL
jgi:20S proteasome alpha/beta subunit